MYLHTKNTKKNKRLFIFFGDSCICIKQDSIDLAVIRFFLQLSVSSKIFMLDKDILLPCGIDNSRHGISDITVNIPSKNVK
jgi:hypothetical protein